MRGQGIKGWLLIVCLLWVQLAVGQNYHTVSAGLGLNCFNSNIFGDVHHFQGKTKLESEIRYTWDGFVSKKSALCLSVHTGIGKYKFLWEKFSTYVEMDCSVFWGGAGIQYGLFFGREQDWGFRAGFKVSWSIGTSGEYAYYYWQNPTVPPIFHVHLTGERVDNTLSELNWGPQLDIQHLIHRKSHVPFVAGVSGYYSGNGLIRVSGWPHYGQILVNFGVVFGRRRFL